MKKVFILFLIAGTMASCGVVKKIGENIESNYVAKAASHSFKLKKTNTQFTVDSCNTVADSAFLTADNH